MAGHSADFSVLAGNIASFIAPSCEKGKDATGESLRAYFTEGSGGVFGLGTESPLRLPKNSAPKSLMISRQTDSGCGREKAANDQAGDVVMLVCAASEFVEPIEDGGESDGGPLLTFARLQRGK